MKIVTLDNWFLELDENVLDPYKAPEQANRVPTLSGEVFGHPSHEDGKRVRTSGLIAYDPRTEVIESRSGTLYRLGKVLPEYEEAYPNAAERTRRVLSNHLPHFKES